MALCHKDPENWFQNDEKLPHLHELAKIMFLDINI